MHPLISAADGGHVDVVRLLVAHLGAQPGPEFQVPQGQGKRLRVGAD